MSDNPFDVFAQDFKAALPVKKDNLNASAGPPAPINIMAQAPPAPVSVMKQPPQFMQPPPPAIGMNMNNPSGNMMMPMNTGYGAPPAPTMGIGGPYGGVPMGAPMSAPAPMYGNMPPPPMPPSNMYAMPMPYGQPSPAQPSAVPAPAPIVQSQPLPAAPRPSSAAPTVPMSSNNNAFYGASMAPAPMAPPVPPVVVSDPWAAPPMPHAPVPPMPPAPAAYALDDPWGAPAMGGAPTSIVPVPNTSDDPFGVFNTTPAAPATSASVPYSLSNAHDSSDALSVATPAYNNQLNNSQILAAADGGDPWAEMGFGPPEPASAPKAPLSGTAKAGNDAIVPVENSQYKDGELPPGGEWYDARIFTPTLGVMFFKPQELTDSLFLQTDRSLVDALGDRPVVAFIVEGSSARAAGVELGHVLLKVNGIDVKNPKEASRLIKEGPRPLPLLFYVPETTVVVSEGEHMVKYDTRDTCAPNSAKDWKPKYVVIGGIIAQPWMMNMYRSKSEYDIAVIETQARRPVSVKVKQFSLQGARIQNDWQGPQMAKYKNKLHPWKYIVVLPVAGNPIKISSPNLGQLKPVHEGIRRVLMAQQRHQPQQQHYGNDPSDPYAQGQSQHYGGPPPQQYVGPPPQPYGGPPPQPYGGPPPQQYGGPPSQQYGGPPSQQMYNYGGQPDSRAGY